MPFTRGSKVNGIGTQGRSSSDRLIYNTSSIPAAPMPVPMHMLTMP